MTTTSPTQYLDRGEGRIAYDIAGSGPLVLCVPGMADLRSTVRESNVFRWAGWMLGDAARLRRRERSSQRVLRHGQRRPAVARH